MRNLILFITLFITTLISCGVEDDIEIDSCSGQTIRYERLGYQTLYALSFVTDDPDCTNKSNYGDLIDRVQYDEYSDVSYTILRLTWVDGIQPSEILQIRIHRERSGVFNWCDFSGKSMNTIVYTCSERYNSDPDFPY